MTRLSIASSLLALLLAPCIQAQGPSFKLGAQAAVGVPFSGPISIATGDFNGDGVPDPAVSNYSGASVEGTAGSSSTGPFQ